MAAWGVARRERETVMPVATNLCPIPYAGGKSRAASLVWQAFAGINSYIEPCCGTAAVLLSRPRKLRFETINDADGLVVNFWRAVQVNPVGVGRWLERPRSELELSSCGRWLSSLCLAERLRADPSYYDVAAAGVWAWYMSGSINPAVKATRKQQPRLIRQGVLGERFQAEKMARLLALQEALRDVRVLCGDWSAALGRSNHQDAWHTDPVGVFLDPPYEGFEFYNEGKAGISAAVRAWAIEHGNDTAWHIVLCGYEGEHAMPDGWTCQTWLAKGRVSGKHTECIWLSPHCAKESLASHCDRH